MDLVGVVEEAASVVVVVEAVWVEGVRGEHEPFPARCQPCSEVSRGPCVGVHGGCVSLSLAHVVVGLLYGER
jgi:hypothetical protein